MHSSTKMRFSSARDQNPFGYRWAIKTQNSSTKEPASGIKKTTFLESHLKGGNGAHLRTTLQKKAIQYFQDLFILSSPTNFNEVLNLMDHLVTLEMNNTLLQGYNPEEVKQVLFQIHPSKSPGPDGMSLFFFINFGI